MVRESDADPETRLRELEARRQAARAAGDVTLRLPAGGTQTCRLVGEDEADAARGLLSWLAPLAQSLLGREAGEVVPFQGGEAEIVAIEP